MKKSFVLVVLISLLWAIPSYAQSESIANGVAWLSANQNADGSWGTQTDLALVCSAETVNALISSGTGTTVSAVNWLTSQHASATDELSRTITSLASAGSNSAVLVTSLISNKNVDGGWGYGLGNTSDALDTALALQALKAANYSDTTVLYQAINFLTTNQNTDGGWGFVPGNESNTYVTAMVLRALSGYSSTFSVQSAIGNAAAFLLAKQTQNNDGGFGSSPSTVYETALSFMALIESGQGSTQQLQNGINYLVTAQSTTNGSWNEDPYSTALALQALASARPNLTASSISFSKSMPQDGESVTITATINNRGLEDASNVIVRFYSGDPATGGTQISTDQLIPSLTPNSSTPVSVTASFTGTGSRTIFVVVDPDSLISETSKLDNKISSRIWIATGPDLAVYSEDLKPSTYVPATGTAFTLEYKVRNLGETAADAFTVSLYDGDPSTGSGQLLQTANISGLNGTETRTNAIGVTLTNDGAHTLYLMADAGSTIQELSETNNIGSVTVTVGGTQTGADLVITAPDITAVPDRPTTGQSVAISARVRNQGAEAAFGFLVELYDGSPEANGTRIASETISLAAGGEQIVNANWTITSGIHDIYVVLDRINTIIESDEGNNRATIRVMPDMVDVNISATDLAFTPQHPVMGDSVVFTITAHNAGIVQTGSFNLALYDGDPGTGGTLLKTYAVSSIQGDGSSTLTYTFTAEPKTYRFYAVADTENVVTEMYEDNNLAVRSLKIKAPGEVLGPDLVPIKIDLDSMTTGTNLAVSGTAYVTFQNKGDDRINTSFSVLIFEDNDNDARYTTGVDNLLGTGTNSIALWPEGASMVSVPLSGTVKFLHSPLYAMIDSGDTILEQDETNNLIRSGADCEVRPANPIEPVVKWKYIGPSYYPTFMGEGINQPPVVARLVDTNSDGLIDEKDVPVILFMTLGMYAPGCGIGNGKIHALRGDTGQELFTIFDTARPICYDGTPHIAVGDIDKDGLPEIIVPRICNYISSWSSLVAYDHAGNLKWDNCARAQAWDMDPVHAYKSYTTLRGMPVIADIDGDGQTEIVAGATAVNGSDGAIKWDYTPNSGTGNSQWVHSSIVADIDLDGSQEVIAGNTAYNSDGTVKWWNKSLTDGITAVGNMDDDAYPEIVLVTANALHPYELSPGARVYLLDHKGNIKWGPVNLYVGYMNTPPPVIADFDGDGEVEIGIRNVDHYLILDKSGKRKMTISLPLSNIMDGYISAPTVFDLNGDGRPEIMFNSDRYFKVFDGRNGTLMYQDPFGSAGGLQGVIVADVDGDGHAEAVVSGYNYSSLREELRVYGSASNNWVRTRGIWNQASYHITNVNDDGTIPQHEAPSWLVNNTYRCQARVDQSPNPYLTPNLTASYPRANQNGTSVDLAVRIGNGGAIASGPSVTVTFYDGVPATGTLIGTAATTRALRPGEYQDIILSVNTLSEGLHHIYAVVDASNAVLECREDDNQAPLDLTITTGLPDLKVGSEDIVILSAPITEGSIVPVSVTVSNIGLVPASNVIVKLSNGNPVSGGTWIGLPQTISSISAGGSSTLTFSVDTLGHAGQNILYVSVDPENTISEAAKANNTALLTIDVQPPTIPNLTVSPDAVQITPASAGEGYPVTITATITNRGTAVGNIPVKIAVRGQGAGGSEEKYSETKTIYPIIGLGQSATVQASMDTAGFAGQYEVAVTVDPANRITESSKIDNTASKALFIQSAGLTSSVTLDKAAYQANEIATATITISNATADPRSLTAGIVVKDSAGNLIATISSGEAVTIGPNSSITLTKTWNIGKTLSGNYSFTAENAEEGKIISRVNTNFSIIPAKSLQAKVTTDKVSYNPNETAAITSTVTSTSPNYIFENVSAKMTVGSVGSLQSAVYSETKTIATLMPGAAFTFKTYWSTGAYAPGTYPVTLEVKDAAGSVLATSTTSFELLTTTATGAGLAGAITATPSPVTQGRDESISYTVTNSGNEDLSGMTVTVIVADPETGDVKAEYSRQYAVGRGETAAEMQSISTSNLQPRTYLAVLQVKTASMAQPKSLASALFEVKPGIAVTKTTPDVANVLVWVNKDCGLRISDCGLEKLEEALREAVTSYRLVYDKKDFATELRNPIYTDILVLGDHSPIEDHVSEELREQVYAGRGLITSLFNRQNLDEAVFGIRFTGFLPGEGYLIDIPENDLDLQGSFQTSRRAAQIETADPADVLSWISETTSKGEVVRHAAIVKHRYGNGKVLFFAFDLTASADTITFPALLKHSLAYVHAPQGAAGFGPNRMAPVEITIKSLGAAFDLRVVETYAEELKLYDPGFSDWLPAKTWTRQFHLGPDEEKTILYYALAPDQAGVYSTQTEIGYLENGTCIPYQTLPLDITVAQDSHAMAEDTLSALMGLTVAKSEQERIDQAAKYVKQVLDRSVLTPKDAEDTIEDLRKAVDELLEITSVDTGAARLLLDGLLAHWQAEWYFGFSR